MNPAGYQDRRAGPRTYAERGVAAPFTTPALAGVRIRASAKAVELVVAHHSGARGMLILPCADLPAFTETTMHDLLLVQALSGRDVITPVDMRRAARSIAASGAAGRAAKQSAREGMAEDSRAVMHADLTFMRRLIGEFAGVPCPMSELDVRGKAAIQNLARSLGKPPAVLADEIAALVALSCAVGLEAAGPGGRCTRLVGALAALLKELEAARARFKGRLEVAVSLLLSALVTTITLARQALGQVQARAAKPAALLAEWIAAPDKVADLLARPDWILDGWDLITLIWQVSGETGRYAAISEMALMVPPIPAQAASWTGQPIPEDERSRWRIAVHGFEDWRVGSHVIDLIARNEHIRALAA
jgi:hypothetical protein